MGYRNSHCAATRKRPHRPDCGPGAASAALCTASGRRNACVGYHSEMHSHLSRTMLRLALLASLLLALVPSLVRLGGHTHAHGFSPARVAGMHAMHRLHAHGGAMPGAGGGVPWTPADDDGDCAYCPLLASLALATFVLLVLPPQRAPGWQPAWFTIAPKHSIRHPCGLGSRGPPLAA